MSTNESHVFLNPDGYVEMVLIGVLEGTAFRDLLVQVQTLIEVQPEPVNGLIDGRRGRMGRDARSISSLMSLGRLPNLKEVFLLIDENQEHPHAAPGPGVIASVMTTALGFGPVYVADEAKARKLASAT